MEKLEISTTKTMFSIHIVTVAEWGNILNHVVGQLIITEAKVQ